jgi:hypothetical protein
VSFVTNVVVILLDDLGITRAAPAVSRATPRQVIARRAFRQAAYTKVPKGTL